MQSKMGDRSHLKLNIAGKPIAKKYREGKVKRTLKRRSKVLEIVMWETNKYIYRLLFDSTGVGLFKN